MKEIRFTLLSDGSSDKALIPILAKLLVTHLVECAIQPKWADLRRLPRPPTTLSQRIKLSLDLYPCDLIFIHRDAEKQSREKRITEIADTIAELKKTITVPPAIHVIPVRMTEAWLLVSEPALRLAAGNPNGQNFIQLPTANELESLPNPKKILLDLLCEASGLRGRRRNQFQANVSVHRIAEFIEDFSMLRQLSAFRALEADIQQIARLQG